jgi:hypothetical protein
MFSICQSAMSPIGSPFEYRINGFIEEFGDRLFMLPGRQPAVNDLR